MHEGINTDLKQRVKKNMKKDVLKMEWMSLIGEVFKEYLRQTANQETEFLWLLEQGGEALMKLLMNIL